MLIGLAAVYDAARLRRLRTNNAIQVAKVRAAIQNAIRSTRGAINHAGTGRPVSSHHLPKFVRASLGATCDMNITHVASAGIAQRRIRHHMRLVLPRVPFQWNPWQFLCRNASCTKSGVTERHFVQSPPWPILFQCRVSPGSPSSEGSTVPARILFPSALSPFNV